MCGLLRRLLATFLVLACLLYPNIANECRFPKSWKGLWYQSGLGELLIRSSSINLKGLCVEHNRDYFLLEDLDNQCYRCLLMMRKHRNIIQYRETYCVPPADLRNVCTQIRVESPLYTIVRIPTNTVPCPFDEAYKFRYSGHMTGQCSGQASAMTPCVSDRRLSLHFNHCYDDAFLHDKVLELECLATWKDGSEMHLYARISGSAADLMDNDIYRCFKYEVYGPDLYVSMSADATCMGLESARQGPVTMAMQTDPYGSLQPSCVFPTWFRSHDTWRDLSGHRLYSLGGSGKEVMLRHRQRHGDHTLMGQLRCIEPALAREGELHLLSYSTHECLSSYQCVSIWSLGPGLAAMRMGEMKQNQDRSVCASEAGAGVDHAAEILIAQPSPPQPCPISGLYQRAQDLPSDNNATCRPLMAAGCNSTSTLTLQGACLPEIQRLECVRTLLIGNGTRALLIADNHDRVGCVTYRLEGDVKHINIGRCDGISHKEETIHGVYQRIGGCSAQIPVTPDPLHTQRATTRRKITTASTPPARHVEEGVEEEEEERESKGNRDTQPDHGSSAEQGSSENRGSTHERGTSHERGSSNDRDTPQETNKVPHHEHTGGGQYPADSGSEPRVQAATPHVTEDTSPHVHEQPYYVLGAGDDDVPRGSKGVTSGNKTWGSDEDWQDSYGGSGTRQNRHGFLIFTATIIMLLLTGR